MPQPTPIRRDATLLVPAILLFIVGVIAVIPATDAGPHTHLVAEVLRWLAILLIFVYALGRLRAAAENGLERRKTVTAAAGSSSLQAFLRSFSIH